MFFFALATVLFGCALGAGAVAAFAPVSPRKGKSRLLAYAAVGMAFLALATPLLVHQFTRHPVSFTGTITSVHRAGGKSSPASLQVQLANGCNLTVQAYGASKFFRPGQALRGQYDPDGTLVFARFFDKNGRKKATYSHRMILLLPWGILAIGLLIPLAGWLVYRRDPLGGNLVRRRE